MKTLLCLTKRNIKIFFKDKGLVISSLITPIILLVLYVTFLAKVYRESFRSSLPEGMAVSDSLVNGTVAAQLFASLIAVSCVTVAFCCNLLMVQDKANGPKKDFLVTPVSRATVAAKFWAISSSVNTYFTPLWRTCLITPANLRTECSPSCDVPARAVKCNRYRAAKLPNAKWPICTISRV